jgi:aquaporin TIP
MTVRARAWLAELVGTFAFMAILAASVIVATGANVGTFGLLGIATAHGVALAALVSAFGQHSGAHFNPAVTFSAWLGRKMEAVDAAGYVVMQLAGALAAAFMLKYLFTQAQWSPSNLATPGLTVSVGRGLLAEAVFTFILVVVIWGTGIDERGPRIGGIAIGFTLFGLLLVDGPLTGAGLNPARYLGSAIVSGHYKDWWVYIVGPGIGAAVAVLYSYVFMGTELPRASEPAAAPPPPDDQPPLRKPAVARKPAARKRSPRA